MCIFVLGIYVEINSKCLNLFNIFIFNRIYVFVNFQY